MADDAAHYVNHRPLWTVFGIFLRLGLTSFGGPVAHLAYFRQEFVTRRQWLTAQHYADLVALCQFLPGPASSQVGMAIGLSRAGIAGAVAAWLGFTLPSALLLILLAMGLGHYAGVLPPGILHGLKVVAVAVVVQAVWGMARQLCTDSARLTLMVAAACVALLWPAVWGQLLVMMVAGVVGLYQFPAAIADGEGDVPSRRSRVGGLCWLAAFALLLVGLPLLAKVLPSPWLAQVDVFYRAGALVFGGGHVVLPLLQAAVVPNGWVSDATFLAGYGAAQAVPGPLFTFSAFLGASMQSGPTGWSGGLLCLLAIFAPSFLLVVGALPFWQLLRRNARVQAALAGINAAVVGLLLAALYHPVVTSSIGNAADAALALLAWLALVCWRLPPWLVVAGSGVAGWLQAALL